MHNLRTFFGKTTINNEDAEQANFDRMYLEYYKNVNEREIKKDEKPYGVTIIKKTQIGKILEIEEKKVKNIFLLQIELIIFITPVSRITFSC